VNACRDLSASARATELAANTVPTTPPAASTRVTTAHRRNRLQSQARRMSTPDISVAADESNMRLPIAVLPVEYGHQPQKGPMTPLSAPN
jgi:hypothetical protein